MKPSEVADLLVIDAGLNRYASSANQSADKAVAWSAAINVKAAAMTFEEARQLVVEHYAGSDKSLTPFALFDAWLTRHRLMPKQVAADVRSAKARGLIGRDWDPRTPLPREAAGRLAAARAEAQGIPALESGPANVRYEVVRLL